MSYLISNVPYFKVWVRKEFTAGHQKYHGEFIHGLAFAVNSIPDRSLSFQVVFTGCEIDYDDHETKNVHGGAMWARMPIQGLVADIPLDEWPDRMGKSFVSTLGLHVSSSFSNSYGQNIIITLVCKDRW